MPNSVLGTLSVNIALNDGKFTASMGGVTSAMKKVDSQATVIGKKMTSVGKQMSSVGKNLALKVTLPILGVGLAATKSFADFDKAMINSTAIMGDITDDVKKDMRSLALSMSKEGVFGATSLAESYYFLASAGLTVDQQMKALEPTMQFAQAGMFDMAKATDLLTDAQTALGLSSKDSAENAENMIRVSDGIVRSATLANASVQQFAESLTADAATAMSSFGIELETGLALLSAYASKGKKGAESGNLLGRAIRLTSSAARKNSEEWDKLGVAVFDSMGNARNMVSIMDDLGKATKNMSDKQRGNTLELLGFKALAQKSVTPLLDMGDAMKDWEKQLLSAAGTTKDVANKQLKSFSAQLKILWNNVTALGIKIGEALAPVIISLIPYIKQATNLVSGMSSHILAVTLAIAGIVAAAPILLIVLGSLISAIGTIVTFVAGLSLAVVVLTAKILLVVGAVVAVGAAFLYFASGASEATTWTEKLALMWEFLKESAISLWNDISPIFNDLKSIFMDWVFIWKNEIAPLMMPLLSGAFAASIMFIKNAFEGWLVPIKLLVKGIADLIGFWKELSVISGQEKEIEAMEKRLKAMQDAKAAGITGEFLKDPNIASFDTKNMSASAIEALSKSTALKPATKTVEQAPKIQVPKMEVAEIETPGGKGTKTDTGGAGFLQSGSLEAFQADLKARAGEDPQKTTNKELKTSNKYLKKISSTATEDAKVITVDDI